MSASGTNGSVEELIEALRSGSFQTVLFLVGSAVSCAGKTPCAGVGTIRNELVLQPLSQAFDSDQISKRDDDICRLARVMCDPLDPLGAVVEAMPFEQFMTCLNAVDPGVSFKVVTAACYSSTKSQFEPNYLHLLIGKLSSKILSERLAHSVAVLTTNYDLGLDLALEQEIGNGLTRSRDSESEANIPAYTLLGGKLTYLKVHGCITHPHSLVFTMERMAELTFQPEKLRALFEAHGIRQQAVGKTLVISIGYSFSDPDLRPHWQHLFAKNSASVWQLIRKTESKDDKRKTRIDSVFRGIEFAQNTFFQQIDHFSVPCNLFETVNHPLVKLGIALGINVSADTMPHWAPLPEIARQPAIQAIESLTTEQAAEFIGRVCDSCTRSDGIKVSDEAALANSWEERTPKRFYLSFSQRGHIGDHAGQELVCRKFRQAFSTREAQLLGWGLSSFPLTISAPTPVKAVKASTRLFWSHFYFKGSDAFSRNIFLHYDLHFRLKLRLKFVLLFERFCRGCAVADSLFGKHTLEKTLRNSIWSKLLRDLMALNEAFSKEFSMLDIAQATDLLVQCHVLARGGDLEMGLTEAEASAAVSRMQAATLALNKPHNVAWIERTMGWYELGRENTSSARLKAIVCFCTASLRGTYSPHQNEDLLSKMIPQLLRVLKNIEKLTATPNLLPLDNLPPPVGLGELRLNLLMISDRAKQHLQDGQGTECEVIDWAAARNIASFYFSRVSPAERVSVRQLIESWSDPQKPQGNLFLLPIFPYVPKSTSGHFFHAPAMGAN